MTMLSPSVEPKVLLGGLAMVESPRWHDGRLWFAHWGTGEIQVCGCGGRGIRTPEALAG
ncbi:MAG: SMP-30/gluconolactonase/LRE family protein, partial [Chloroflexi bacterium]